MLKNKLHHKLLVAGIVGTLLVSSEVVAFAATTSTTGATKTAVVGKIEGGFRGEGKGFKHGDSLAAVLKTQVTAGVITQVESDKITAYLATKEAADKVARTALKVKLSTMTDAQKKVYMEANKPVKTDALTGLVKASLLTQTQADKIKAALPQRPEGERKHGGNPVTYVLKTQVTAGVITQAESDKATAFLKTKSDAEKAKYDAMTTAEKTAAQAAKKVARDAEKAKLNAMTDVQKKAYFEANKSSKVNILSELVTAGIFTQTQADKIQAAMPQRHEMGKVRGEASTKGANTTGTSSTVTE